LKNSGLVRTEENIMIGIDKVMNEGGYGDSAARIENLMTEYGEGEGGLDDLLGVICNSVLKLCKMGSDDECSMEMLVDSQGRVGKGISGKIGGHVFDMMRE
jgi:hypothetical protein